MECTNAYQKSSIQNYGRTCSSYPNTICFTVRHGTVKFCGYSKLNMTGEHPSPESVAETGKGAMGTMVWVQNEEAISSLGVQRVMIAKEIS